MKNLNYKSCLYLGDMNASISEVTRSSVFNLESFYYETARRKDAQSIPYGPPMRSVIDFSLTTKSDGYLKSLYKALAEKEEKTFSFIINALFDEKNVLKGFDSAFMITGYVTSVEEDFNGGFFSPKKLKSRMSTKVSLLINNINYIGNDDTELMFQVL